MTQTALDERQDLADGVVYQWRITGTSPNVFGAMKDRSLIVSATTEEQARNAALAQFDSFVVTEVHWTHTRSVFDTSGADRFHS
jgi:hypothetical protein